MSNTTDDTMAAWDQVAVDFGGDETNVFGPRQESGTALYEVTTVAIITATGEVSRDPVVTSATTDVTQAVAVDSHVTLFSDSCHHFLANLAFGSHIDAVAVTEDGNFVVVGEKRGMLHIISVHTQTPIMSRELMADNEGGFKVLTFTESTTEGTCDLLILCGDNRMHIFSNLQTKCLHAAVEVGDVAAAKDIQANMKHCVVDLSSVHSQGVLHGSMARGTHSIIVTAGCGDSVLCTWQRKGEEYKCTNSVCLSSRTVRKCILSQCGEFLFVLDDTNLLSLWSTHNLVVLRSWPATQVIDFHILAVRSTNGSLEETKLVLLTPAADGACSLHVSSLPQLHPVYTLQLAAHVRIASCGVAQEAFYVVEGESGSGELTESLRVRRMTEAKPEDSHKAANILARKRNILANPLLLRLPSSFILRFSRLLHKKRFEEAISFARLYDLDQEYVHKVKLNHLLDQLIPESAARLGPEDLSDILKDFMDTLRLIQDDEHMARCCLGATLPTWDANVDTLMYAKTLLSRKDTCKAEASKPSTSQDTKDNLLTAVLERLHRLGTYQQMFCHDEFRDTRWAKFQKANMLKEFLRWINLGETSVAFTIWNRHQFEFEDGFTGDVLEDILDSIPESTTAAELRTWLSEDFLPFVIRRLPDGLEPLAVWVEQKARNMEFLEQDGWPANALEFCCLLQHAQPSDVAASKSMATPAVYAAQMCSLVVGHQLLGNNEDPELLAIERQSAFYRLRTLTAQLGTLLKLRTRYHCLLSHAVFVKETTESLIYQMLDRVPSEDMIPAALRDVVQPYMKEHGLSQDKMLCQYVGYLADKSGKQERCMGWVTWEDTATAVIGCIKDKEFKFQAILDALLRASIPLSDDMEALVEEELSFNHPRVAELRDQCRNIKLTQLLYSYHLGEYGSLYSNEARLLVRHILKQDRPSAVADALEVVSATEQIDNVQVYDLRLKQLIETGRLEECQELFRSLSPEVALDCGTRLLSYTLTVLDNTIIFDQKAGRRERLLYTKATCDVLTVLVSHHLDDLLIQDLQSQLRMLQNMLNLELEFGIWLRPGDCHTDGGDAAMRQYVIDHVTGTALPCCRGGVPKGVIDKKPGELHRDDMTRLMRLGDLLNVPRLHLKRMLAIAEIDAGHIDKALCIAHSLFDDLPAHAAADVMYYVGHAFYRHLAGVTEDADRRTLLEVIGNLAGHSATFCRSALRCDAVELSGLVSLDESISRQCDGVWDDSVAGVGGLEADDWTHPPDGLPRTKADAGHLVDFGKKHFLEADSHTMEASCILPLLRAYAIAAIPSADPEQGRWPYKQSRMRGRSSKEGPTDGHVGEITQKAGAIVQHLKVSGQNQLALGVIINTHGTVLEHYSAQRVCGEQEGQDMPPELGPLQQAIAEANRLAPIVLQKFSVTLLNKMFKQRHLDHGLALGYAAGLSKGDSSFYLNSMTDRAGSNYTQLVRLARLGIDLGVLRRDAGMEESCRTLELNARWGRTLSKLKVKVEGFTTNKSLLETKRHQLQSVVRNHAVDVNHIKKFCRDFQVDEQEAMLLFVDFLLLGSRAAAGDCSGSISRQCLERAAQAVRHITMTTQLFGVLNKAYKKVSPYDYECLRFILEEWNKIEEEESMSTKLRLLGCLESYTRVAAPSDVEMAYVNDTGTGEITDPLAKTRLPFHLFFTANIWKVITPEITTETINMWLSMTSLLKLSSDKIYMTMIQNMVKSYLNDLQSGHQVEPPSSVDKAKCDWRDKEGSDLKFFHTILDTLINKVQNCSLAMACAKWLVSELPMGSEKVLALQYCVTLAKKWVLAAVEADDEERKKAGDAMNRFTNYYRRLRTEQLLFVHHVGDEDLVALSNSPAKLIAKLYEHPSITQRDPGGLLVHNTPDIHGVAEQIGAVHQMSLQDIHLKLLEKWLPSKGVEKMDMTLNMTFDQAGLDVSVEDSDADQDEISLRRVAFVLNAGLRKSTVLFLLNYATKEESSQITNRCRVRALQCLFSLVDSRSACRMASQPITQLRSLVQTLLYLGRMDELHMDCDRDAFLSCNKMGLVRGIWRNHSHDKRAVRLVADACLDFHIHDAQLWSGILRQLVTFNMVEYLRHVLLRLSGIPSLWKVGGVQIAWQRVLSQSLDHAVASSSKEGECLQSYCLLHRCPRLLELDLVAFSQRFLQANMAAAALGTLLLVTDTASRGRHLAALLDGRESDVLADLATWQARGLSVPLAQQIEWTVLEHLSLTGQYAVASSVSLETLAHYIVARDRPESLLTFLLDHERVTDAVNLMTLYCSAYPESSAAAAVSQEEDDVNKLRAFCESRGLREEAHLWLPPSEGDTSVSSSTDRPAYLPVDDLDLSQ